MLKTRIVTALVLVAAFLAAIFLLPLALTAALFAAVVALAGWEWAGLLHMRAVSRWLYAAATFVACVLLYAMGIGSSLVINLWFVALVFWIAVVPLWLRAKWRLAPNAVGALVGWLVLLPAWAALVSLEGRNPLLLLAAMAVVWVADIAAYFGGRSLGRRKLAPTISPGKTWEGAFSALVAVEVYGFAVVGLMGLIRTPVEAAIALFGLAAVTAISIVGDLFESMAKRQAGQKDSSAILPGHGGILDRIDSLTSSLPLAALAAVMIAR